MRAILCVNVRFIIIISIKLISEFHWPREKESISSFEYPHSVVNYECEGKAPLKLHQ